MGKSAFVETGPVCVAELLKTNYAALGDALTTFRDAVKCDCMGISWFEPGEEQVRILPYGLPELTEFEATPAMPGKTICCYPLMTRKPLAIRQFESDAPLGFTRCNFMVAEGLNSYLAYPVFGLGPDIRMLACALSYEVRDWSANDIAHARSAAQAIMLILGPMQGNSQRVQH